MPIIPNAMMVNLSSMLEHSHTRRSTSTEGSTTRIKPDYVSHFMLMCIGTVVSVL